MSKARDIADLDFNAPDIDGGNIDGAVIGGTTPAAGTFSQVNVDNITIDGNEIDVSSGDLTLDVAGDIILDADGEDILLKDGGVEFGLISGNATDFTIMSRAADRDLIFKGKDGGSSITALTLDMSAAGQATFNSNVVSGGGLFAINGDGTYAKGLTIAKSGEQQHYIYSDGPTQFNGIGSSSANWVWKQEGGANKMTLSTAGAATFSSSVTANPIYANSDGEGVVYAGILQLRSSNTASGHFFRWDVEGTQAANKLVGYWNDGAYRDRFSIAGNTGETVVNDSGQDVNFRVESSGNANMLFVDGGNNFVGIGDNTNTGYTLNVAGSAQVRSSFVVTSGGGANLTQGDIMIKSSTSDSPSARGQGVFLFNEGVDQTWYAGTGYNAAAHYHIGFAAGTSASKEGARVTAGVFHLYNNASGAVFNENGADRDFRVESNVNTHAFYLNAVNGNIGLNAGAAPHQPLTIGATAGANLNYYSGTTNVISSASGIKVSKNIANDAGAGSGLNLSNSASTNGTMSPIIHFSAKSNSNTYNTTYAGIWGRKLSNGTDTNWNVGSIEFGTAHSAGIHKKMELDYLGGLITTPITGGHAVFNEGGVDADFRVESVGVSNMLQVDGGSNGVGIRANGDGNQSLKIKSTGSTGNLTLIEDEGLGDGSYTPYYQYKVAYIAGNSSNTQLTIPFNGRSYNQTGYLKIRVLPALHNLATPASVATAEFALTLAYSTTVSVGAVLSSSGNYASATGNSSNQLIITFSSGYSNATMSGAFIHVEFFGQQGTQGAPDWNNIAFN